DRQLHLIEDQVPELMVEHEQAVVLGKALLLHALDLAQLLRRGAAHKDQDGCQRSRDLRRDEAHGELLVIDGASKWHRHRPVNARSWGEGYCPGSQPGSAS